jgi:hypothetical protein
MKTLALISVAVLATSAAFANPVIQVRNDPKTPHVTIVAWDAAQTQYGLRTRLRRDGSHLGEGRVGEHRLFLNSVYVETNGGFAHAMAHTGKLLRNAGSAKDVDACRFGSACAPAQTIGLGLPDDFLRENRDSIVVTMRPRSGHNWTIRLDRDLISAYLATVDSASAALKK